VDGSTTTWTVVVVDDDPAFCELIRMALVLSTKWRVFAMASAAEARTFLSAVEVDVLLVDERMPGERGSELLSSLRGEGRLKGTTAILLTAERQTPLGAGVAGRIEKPFDALKLAERIARIVRDQRTAAAS
jgi:DNA-binding response OmpR family regulator